MLERIEITDPNEIHLILVNKYQKSSVNIVLRSMVNTCFPYEVIEKSVLDLMLEHPYLSAKYSFDQKDGEFRYYYEEVDVNHDNVNLIECNDEDLICIMNSLSKMRTHLFDFHSGKLFNVNVYQGRGKSLIELTCAHIIGEVPSVIILLNDLLRFIELNSLGEEITINRRRKYIFDENIIGCDNELAVIEVNDLEVTKLNPWDMADCTFRRYKFSVDFFLNVKKWLLSNKIDAKVSDVFYFIVNEVLRDELSRQPKLWLILSFRGMVIENEFKKSIYNFAFFSPIDSGLFNSETPLKWIESFFKYRSKLVSNSGVCEMKKTFRSLNKLMEDKSVKRGSRIMNSIVKFPDFSFNNFGRIDEYLESPKSFKIIDLDVQDGTPMQEVRYFSFNNEIYMAPTFFKKNNINIDEFWSLFNSKLAELITHK